jgi:hypothetical protein
MTRAAEGITLTPLAYVMISAALRNMNPALVEAASVHGVSKWIQRAGRHLQPGGMIYIRFPAGKLKIFPK